MPFVVRKIEFSKWDQRNIFNGAPPSADAITNCMKTRGNKLSLWLISDEGEREEAVVAIASNFDHLDTIDILLINPSLITEKGLTLEPSQGDTLYQKFKDKHYNVINLDYPSLGEMAKVTIESLRLKQWKQFRKSELINILTVAVQKDKVRWSDLKPDVRKKIPYEKMKQVTWTDSDFTKMSWHDCQINSIALDQDGEFQNDLVFEMDYIIDWISASDNTYRFRIAPAVLRFADVDNLQMDVSLSFKQPFQIASLDRSDLPSKGYKIFHWTIRIQNYPGLSSNVIEFDATGFTLELTGIAMETASQSLTVAQRKQLKDVLK
jgi:hypothetical protein